MNIYIGKNREQFEALDIGYNVNGNRRFVLPYIAVYGEIRERTGLEHEALSNRPYAIALDAMRRIGGKKYHNKKYGGGIVFDIDRSQLEAQVNEAIDAYCRWYNSEHVKLDIVNAIADRMKHRLSVVVKSTNAGYVAIGEYSNGLELRTKCAYDHDLSLTGAPLKAALLWAAKAEYKRWQLNGQESFIKILSDYTAVDANTRVYHYTIEGV